MDKEWPNDLEELNKLKNKNQELIDAYVKKIDAKEDDLKSYREQLKVFVDLGDDINEAIINAVANN